MKTSYLVDQLKEHKTLGAAPREELEWLVSHGVLRSLAAGEVLSRKGLPVEGLFVVLSGHVTLSVDRGNGPQKMIEWHAGDVSGVLPYSRMVNPPGDAIAEEPTEILEIHRELLQALTRECYEVTAILVRVMLDRARLFNSTDLHNEKMISLGKLSAGLAHELNNPASTIERSAALLVDRIEDTEKTARVLGEARLNDAQLAAIDAVREACLAQQPHAGRSALEQMDREDAIANWLGRQKIDTSIACLLADTEVTFAALDQIAAVVTGASLEAVLRWAAAGCSLRRIASSIQGAAMHVSGLVMAVKGFTQMDQSIASGPVDLGKSLADTVIVQQAKARQKSVEVSVHLEGDLPLVCGYAAELNQIWGSLIDNALDAVPAGGHVEVLASRCNQRVVVRIIDNGPGIAVENLARIFDPFFSTKPQGLGMGLGLDIARRLVRHNDGTIEVESQPGRTEFRVSLQTA
ncbi:MAG TPA: ATP-binding protein [Terracidiphilus sp.]|nr:ATP-binding protein [Terracidiphilus sp.]